MMADPSKLRSRIAIAGLAVLLIAGGQDVAAEQAGVDGDRMRHADAEANINN